MESISGEIFMLQFNYKSIFCRELNTEGIVFHPEIEEEDPYRTFQHGDYFQGFNLRLLFCFSSTSGGTLSEPFVGKGIKIIENFLSRT